MERSWLEEELCGRGKKKELGHWWEEEEKEKKWEKECYRDEGATCAKELIENLCLEESYECVSTFRNCNFFKNNFGLIWLRSIISSKENYDLTFE